MRRVEIPHTIQCSLQPCWKERKLQFPVNVRSGYELRWLMPFFRIYTSNMWEMLSEVAHVLYWNETGLHRLQDRLYCAHFRPNQLTLLEKTGPGWPNGLTIPDCFMRAVRDKREGGTVSNSLEMAKSARLELRKALIIHSVPLFRCHEIRDSCHLQCQTAT